MFTFNRTPSTDSFNQSPNSIFNNSPLRPTHTFQLLPFTFQNYNPQTFTFVPIIPQTNTIHFKQNNESNVKLWNCSEVKNWLKSKGINEEIQNIFYTQQIDGETLLFLNENNINKLLQNTHNQSMGTEIKLKQYIKALQNSNSVNSVQPKSDTKKQINAFENNNKNIINGHGTIPFSNNYTQPKCKIISILPIINAQTTPNNLPNFRNMPSFTPKSPIESNSNSKPSKKRTKMKCDMCNDTFSSQAKHKTHMSTVHSILKPYKCRQCPQTYSLFSSLRKHNDREHKNIRNFKCELCPKAFYDKAQLHKHGRVHDGLKPFQCSECNKKFSQKSSLKYHKNTIHLHIKKYKCEHCEKRFGKRSNMCSHMIAIHNSRKYARFECNVCGKGFFHKRLYTQHLRNVCHRAKDPIKEMIKKGVCPYKGCDKKYESRDRQQSVKYHLVTFHKNRKYARYECEECKKLFFDKTSYSKHMSKLHSNEESESEWSDSCDWSESEESE